MRNRIRTMHRTTLPALLLAAALTPVIPALASSPEATVRQQVRITEGYDTATGSLPGDSGELMSRSGTRHGSGHWPPEIWIADVGMSLFGDRDQDGYFSGFAVSIDADIDYGQAEVYASLYLARDDEALRPFHTTAVFSLYDRSATDRYRIEAQLIDAFAPGHYDLLIDLHDAHTGHIVDTVSAVTFRNLENLPLESDDHAPPTTAASLTITEYGGNTGPAALLLLLLASWYRHRARD